MAAAILLLILSGVDATIGEVLITAISDEATSPQTKTPSHAPRSIILAQGEFAPRTSRRRGGSRGSRDDIGSGDVVRDVRVPDLRGRNVDWAERELRDLGLIPSPKAEKHWERPGTIFWQSPTPGRRVSPRTHIKFDYAIWPRVPNVVGERTRTAMRILDAAGYRSRVETVIDPNRPGVITGQDPARGEKLAYGKTVIIYERRLSRMPDVVGLNIREAKAASGRTALRY